MTGNISLDIFIGLIFVYLLFSLLASVLLEIVSTFLRIRANNLRHVIYTMLNDDADKTPSWPKSWWLALFGKGATQRTGGLARAVYHAPLVSFMGARKGRSKGPSYLSPQQFADALVQHMTQETESIARATSADDTKDLSIRVRSFLNTDNNNPLRLKQFSDHQNAQSASKSAIDHLWFLFRDANEDIGQFKASVARWYDEMMGVATEWYKRKMQVWLFLIGLGLAVLFDANTLYMVKVLSLDNSAREQLVQLSEEYLKAHETLDQQEKRKSAAELEATYNALQQQAQGAMAVFGRTRPLPDSITIDTTLSDRSAFPEFMTTQKSYALNQAGQLVVLKQPKMLQHINLGNYIKVENINGDVVPFNQAHFFWGYSLWGYLLTALAISLGAPFWFDLLNKLMRLKGAVAPKAAEEKKDKPNNTGK